MDGPGTRDPMDLPEASPGPNLPDSGENNPGRGVAAGDESLFRLHGRRLAHRVAHQEYGVVFSRCGIRCKATDTVQDPEDVQPEQLCSRCAQARQNI